MSLEGRRPAARSAGGAFSHANAVWLPSPNFGERRAGAIDMLVLHYTGMPDTDAAVRWLCDPGSQVSCHYLVREDGEVLQFVGEEMRAWHAGISNWKGETDINSRSIGIEIANPGHEWGYVDFPDVQIEALVSLCRGILARHQIPPERVLAHSDVAPARKTDPGERFDWRRLHAEGVGHRVDPAPPDDRIVARPGDKGEAVRALQAKLGAYGYGIGETGVFDEPTAAVVRAFQRHFRPARVDGVADTSTLDTLERLLAALDRA